MGYGVWKRTPQVDRHFNGQQGGATTWGVCWACLALTPIRPPVPQTTEAAAGKKNHHALDRPTTRDPCLPAAFTAAARLAKSPQKTHPEDPLRPELPSPAPRTLPLDPPPSYMHAECIGTEGSTSEKSVGESRADNTGTEQQPTHPLHFLVHAGRCRQGAADRLSLQSLPGTIGSPCVASTCTRAPRPRPRPRPRLFASGAKTDHGRVFGESKKKGVKMNAQRDTCESLVTSRENSTPSTNMFGRDRGRGGGGGGGGAGGAKPARTSSTSAAGRRPSYDAKMSGGGGGGGGGAGAGAGSGSGAPTGTSSTAAAAARERERERERERDRDRDRDRDDYVSHRSSSVTRAGSAGVVPAPAPTPTPAPSAAISSGYYSDDSDKEAAGGAGTFSSSSGRQVRRQPSVMGFGRQKHQVGGGGGGAGGRAGGAKGGLFAGHDAAPVAGWVGETAQHAPRCFVYCAVRACRGLV